MFDTMTTRRASPGFGERDARLHEQITEAPAARRWGHCHLCDLALFRGVPEDGARTLDLPMLQNKEYLTALLDDFSARVAQDLAIGRLESEVGFDPLSVELLELRAVVLVV